MKTRFTAETQRTRRRTRLFVPILLCVLCVSAVHPSSLNASNWPQWRGPRGDGVSSETGLPEKWSATENVKWKVPLFGAGVSAPVVWGQHVLLTASDAREHDRLHVLCYHRADGRLLWHTKLFGSVAQPQSMFPPGGMAVPTVATDGERIYALFGTGDLAALDFEGKPIWLRSLAQEYGPFMNRWGMASSPILVDDLVVIQVDHWAKSYLLAVEGKTGRNRWKTDRDAAVNWASPLVVTVNGRKQIVCAGTYKVKGYDTATGKELWSVDGMQMQCIPSLAMAGNTIYAVSGRKGNTLAIKLDGSKGDLTNSHVLWKNHRGAPYVPSPVALGNLYFLVDDNGIATCLSTVDGEVQWTQRLGGGKYHASLLAADGKIYFTSMDGLITVVKADARFDMVGKNNLGEGVVATPAISNGELFIRGEKHLFCIAAKR